MTGRDLILYILENHLEDKEINAEFLGLMTLEEAAVKLQTGPETVRVLASRNFITPIAVGGTLYILPDQKFQDKIKESVHREIHKEKMYSMFGFVDGVKR